MPIEPKYTMPPAIKGKLRELVDEINEFDKECQEKEHTDSVDAWDLLNTIKEKLGRLACDHEPIPESLKHRNGAVYSITCKRCGDVGLAMLGRQDVLW